MTHLHVFSHCGVPSQLASANPHGILPRLRYDLEGRQSWRRLLPLSMRAPQPEICRKRVSAKRSPLWHLRRLAKRTLDRCAWVHLGTFAYNLHMVWKKRHCPYIVRLQLVAFSRPSPLPFPCSWPGTAPFTLLPLSMPPGNSRHAGGLHTDCKPRVGILYGLFFRVAFLHLAPVILLFTCLAVFFLCMQTSRCGA